MNQKEWTWNSARREGVLPKEWLNLTGANLHEADLRGANLTKTNFHGANLHWADLRWANLHETNLHEANLHGADLRWADLRDANLTKTNFHEADLHWADLRWADLRGADLRGVDLHEADLRGANLTEANIDFSCWPLWCGSLGVKVDKKQATQIMYHACSLNCDDPEYQTARAGCLDFVNQMHRSDVPRLERSDT